MAKSIQVFVNTGNEDNNQVHQFVQGGGDKGKPTRIKAVKGARYQLKDPALKDVGPEYIRSKRVGKNLHVSLDGSNEADLIIEGYYDEGYLAEDSTGLYGKAEDGQLYEYIPEDPTTAGLSANLVDGAVPVSQVLGGVPYGEAFALSALPLVGAALGGFAPLLVGAGLLGAAALAANRDNTTAAPSGQTGGLSSDSDTGSNNADGITNNKTPSYSGKAVAGSTVEVTINGKTYTTVADANGNYTVKIPAGDALPDGTYTPTIKVTNANGTTTSNGTPFTIDTSTTGTGGLTHDAANDTGSNPNDNITNNTKPTFSGTGEPGATVKIVVDGQTLTAVVGADGKWVASGPYTGNGLTGGQHAVVITFTDVAGNTSTVNAAPVFISTGVGNITLSVDAVTADNSISGTEASLNGNTDITGKASGEFKAGQIVTLTINGKTFSGPVDGTGAYKISVPTADLLADPDKTIAASIAVTDTAGNTAVVSTTHPYLADTTPPNANTTTLTINSVTTDNIVVGAENVAGVTTNITGKAFGEFQAGDKVTLTINGKNFFGTVAADGSYSIPVFVTDLAADPGTKIDATLDATDRTGNKGSIVAAHTYVVDTVGPNSKTTALVIDAVTPDNLISGTDTATSINITGKASGEFKAGDKVSFTLNGTRYEGAVDAAGNFSIPVAKTDLTGNTSKIINASLLATDANGNQGTVTNDHPYAVDTTGPSAATTSVTVNPVTADNLINATEAGQVTIAITGRVTGEFKAGDIVTLTVNGKTFTGPAAVDGSYSINVTTTDLIADTDKTIASSVVATDAAGNTGTVIGNTQTYLLDNVGPNSSGTTLIIDAVTTDNIVNVAESQNTNTTVTGKVVGEFTVGDTVTLRIHNTDYSATVAANGTYSVSVLTNDLLADGDKTIAGSIVARDASGNTGTISATGPYIVDTVAPSSPSSAAINVNPVTADNLVNAAESNGRVDVTGLVTGEFQSGDVVTLVINNVSYTGTVNSSGVYSINVSGADLAADPDKTIAASVAARDTAGNVGTASNTHVYAVDTVSPNPAGTTLSVNVVTADNVINGDESLPTNTNVTGKATGVFRSGDTVTLTINGKDFTGTVDAAGDYTISVTTADLVADGDKTINAKIAATSSAGNVGTITTTHTYTVDITPPSATTTTLTVDVVTPDNIINGIEGAPGAANIPVTGKAAGTFTAGDTVTLTINNKTFTGNVAADGSYSINVPATDLAADSDKTIAASIAAHDAVGNLGTVTSARAYAVDTVAPSNATTVLTLDPITADNIINISESGVSTTTVTGKASGEFKAGDVVTLSLVVGGITKTVTTTVNAAGNFSVNVPTSDLVNDGDKTIVASLAATDAAGNVAAAGSITADQLYVVDTLAPANTALRIDAVTADDIINAAEAGLANLPITGKVTGEFTTGDVVTLTINGKPFTGSVDVNGNYSINVPTTDLRADPDLKIDGSILARDAAGNTGTFSATRPYLVDNTGPSNTTTALSVNVVATDDTINAAESGLASIPVTGKVTGEFKSGDIVTLTVNGNTFTGPVDASGNYSINVATADLLADPDKTIAASIVATDAVGNTGTISAAHPYLVDTTPPSDGTTTISVNVVTPDNIINSSEATQTRTSVTGKVEGEFTAGDIVTITVNGNTATGTLDANGNYTVSVLTADLVAETGKTLTATVAARDPAGNIANVSTNHRYAVDTIAPNGGAALGLTIDPDTNNDGTIGYTELPGAGSLNVTATFDKTKVAVGDIVTFTPVGGTAQTVALTQAMVDAGKVTVAFATPANGSTLDVTATLSDVAGNATVPARDTATVNSTNPNASATIDIAAITTDSGIAGDFVTNDTTLTYSGTLTGFVLNGDKVKVELLDASGNVVETQTVTPTSATTWTFTPTAAQAAGNYTLRATIVDAAGTRVNATAPVNGTNGGQDTQLIVIDTAVPTTTVDIRSISDDTGVSATDFITKDNNGLTVSATLSTALLTGEKLFYSRDNGVTWIDITSSVNGTAVTHIDSLLTSTTTVQMRVQDVAGNVGSNDTQLITIDTVAPTPVVNPEDPLNPPAGRASLVLDPITADNIITSAEGAQANVAITGTARGDFTEGDTVTLTINNKTFTGTVASNGIFSINVPGADLLADSDAKVVASLAATDKAGNVGTVTDDQTYTVTTTAPNGGKALGLTIDADTNNDGLVNFTEIGNTNGTANTVLSVSATFTPSLVKVGDIITFTNTATGSVQRVTLTQAMKDAGVASTTFPSPGDNATLNVKATITDGTLGNTGPEATDSARFDLSNLNPVSPSTKRGVSIEITSDTNNDSVLNTAEINGSTTANVKVTLPTDAKEGDVLVITGTGNSTQSITLAAAHITAGFITTTFSMPANGNALQVTAQVTDAAGNTSNLASDTATVNTTPVGSPTVEITTDTNDSGFISRAELGNATTISVKTTLPTTTSTTAGAAVGDTITVTDGTTPKTHVLTQADINAGFVTDTFAKPVEGGTLNVSATLTKVGGNSSQPGTDSALLDTSSFVDPTDPTKSGLTVVINTDSNNDGNISTSELTTTFKATVTLPAQAAVGDTLTLNASGNNPRTIILTQAMINAHEVVVTDLTPTGNGTTFTVSASLVDRAGNATPTPDASDFAVIKTSAPNGGVAPTVEITTDIDNSGIVNATELNGATTFAVKGSFDKTKVVAGDQMVFSDGTTTKTVILTSTDIGNGFATTTFTKPSAEGGTLTVTAKLQDSLGNATPNSSSDSASLDTVAPNGNNPLDLTIDLDFNTSNNGTSNDGTINTAEKGAASETSLTATFDRTKVSVGDKVTFTVGSTTRVVTIAQSDIDLGKVISTGWALPADGVTMTATAVLSDAAGNATPQATDTAKMDVTAPNGGQAVGLTIDLDFNTSNNGTSNDGNINTAELGAATTTSLTATFDKTKVAVGDKVTFAVGSTTKVVTLTQAMIDAGKVVDTGWALPAEGATLTATAVLSDASGNATPQATDTAKLDTVGPNGNNPLGLTIDLDFNTSNNGTSNDGNINTAELGAATTTSLTATFDPSKVAVGDKVTFTVGSTTRVVTIAQSDIDAGKVISTGWALPADGVTMTATAVLSDAAGNATPQATDTAKMDVTAPNGGVAVGLTIDLDVPASNDGIINAAEKGTANETSLTATFDKTKVAVGDKVTFAVGSTTKVVTLTQAMIDAGKVVDTGWALPAEGATLTATAVLSDASGNATPQATDTARLDTAAPNGNNPLGLTIDLDFNTSNNGTSNDGNINTAELGTATTTSLTATFDPSKVAVGDKVTFTIGSTTRVVTIAQSDIDAGKVVSTGWALPADGVTMTATAVLSDAAGNTTPQATDIAKMDATAPNGGQAVGLTIDLDFNTSNNGTSNDGTINTAELGAATTTSLTATFDKTKVAVSDKVTFAVGSTTKVVTLTQAMIDAGKVVDTGWALPEDGVTMTATAVLKDAAGNATPQATDTAKMDVSAPNGGQAVGLTIDLDFNTSNNGTSNDGTISATEKGTANQTSLTATFDPTRVSVGDKVTFTVGSTTRVVTLAQSDIDLGKAVSTGWNLPADGVTMTATAVLSDAAGNATPTATDTAKMDVTAPNGGAALGLTIDLDVPASNDGIISSAEKGSATETSLTATFDKNLVAVGDKVTFSDGTTTKVVTLVEADITAGKVVSTDWALPNEGSTLNVTAVLTDAAGNATPQATDSAKLDTTAPNGNVAPIVSIITDADDNGKVGTAELNGATTFTVQGDFDNTLVFEGDKLVFTAGGVTQTVVLTAQNISDGFATTTFAKPNNGNALTVNVLVQDAAGNQSPVSADDTATLDTTTPTLTISHDKTVLLAGQNSTVTFTFSEEVAGFTLDDIDASGAQGSVTGLTQSTQDPKVWTATFTPTANINDTTNVIKVANDVYTDVAGNKGTGDDSDNFEIKTEVPSVTITLADPALKAGETSLVTYTFSQTPTGFEAGDVTISGAKGTLSDPVVTPGTDNKVWTATFTPTTDVEDTTNVISIAAGTYTNSTGVNGTEGTSANFTIDTKAPTLTIAMADSALVVGETSKVTFTFSEAPTGFTAADVTVPAGIGAISGLAATSNPLVWEALFTPATNVADTANIISVAASTYTDAAGNNGGAAETANFTIDTTVPTVTVVMEKSALKGGEQSQVTFTFSQSPTGFDVADVDMTGAKGALSNLMQDSNNSKVWTATFTPTAQIEDATNIIKVKAESYTNASGNKGTEGVSANFTIDTLPPSTTITIDTIDDNQGTTTGTVASGGVTDDTTPTVKGTLGTALATGETVHIFDNGVDIGTATISVGSTAFTFNDTRTSIVDGSNLKYTAKVFDAAGNSGTASNLYTATITTTMPTIKVTSVALDAIDATHLNGLFDTTERAALTGSAKTLPIISGTTTNVDVGQTVSVTLNGHTYTGTVAGTKASGTWSISVTEADALLLNHGNTYDIKASVSDAAGQTATDTDNKLEVKVGALDIPTVIDVKTNIHTPTLTGVAQKLVSGSPVALDTNDILEITIKKPDGTIAKAISATIGGTDPVGFSYNAATKTWSYDTAAAGLNLADGTYEIIVLATDAVPNPDVQKADISTSELIIDSTAPVFSSGASVDVAENIDISVAANAVVYTAVASDSTTGNHGATFSLKTGGDAAKFSIDAATGKVSIKESPNFEDAANTDHQYSFTVEATDTFGNKSEKAVTLNVTNVNEAPVAVADTIDAKEAGGTANGTAGTDPTGNALTNDTDVDANDTKTVKDIKPSSAASATAVNASTTSADGTEVTGSFGKLKIGADGSYVYTVDNTNATVQALNTSSTALTDVFTYTVKDAAGLTSTATITVSVNGANDAPTVANAIADTTGTEGTALSYVIPANSFADVDDSTLTLSATLADGSALPSWLTFNAGTRTFSGTPPTGTGTVSVKVTATDGSLSANDTFDIVIASGNHAPVGVDDTATAVEAGGTANGTAGTNPTGNVLTNDTDADSGDTKTVKSALKGTSGSATSVGASGNTDIVGDFGTLSIAANGSYTYTVDNSKAEVQALKASTNTLTDTFTYTVKDAAGATSTAKLTVTVNGANDAPVAVADTATAKEAGGVANGTAGTDPTGNVLTNDTDVDANDTKTVQDIKAGSGSVVAVAASGNTNATGAFGTLAIAADGSYVYTVDNTNATVQALNTSSTALTDVFTYTVKDAGGLTSTATITVTINGVNDAPTVANAIADTTGTNGTALTYVIPANSFADVDDSALALSATLADGSALPSWLTFNAGTRTFSGTPTAAGTVSVKVTATDAAGLTANDTFDIVVGAANHAPVPANGTTLADPFGTTSSIVAATTTPMVINSPTTKTGASGTIATITGSSGTATTTATLPSGSATGIHIGDLIAGSSETVLTTFSKPVAAVQIDFGAFGQSTGTTRSAYIEIYVNGSLHTFSANEILLMSRNTAVIAAAPTFSADGSASANGTRFYGTVSGATAMTEARILLSPPEGITSFSVRTTDGAGSIFVYTVTEGVSQPNSSKALTVEALFGGTNFSDSDTGDSFKGVVITGAGSPTDITSKGTYQFSKDGGTTWTDLAGGLSDAGGIYLNKTDLIRFKGASTAATAIKQNLVAHLVDTSTASSTFTTSGATVNVSGANSGGSTAVSSAAITIAGSTAPVVLDLNHDGVLSYGQVQMDVLGTGHLQQTSWADSQDGVLVWDKYADGKVHDNSQYAFAQYGAAGSTDLQGLAAGFDSNHDGVFNAQDAKFAQFAVWQDANQDGVVEACEMHSLSEAGITAINLTSDGVVRVPNAQVVEAGHSTAQLADGSTMVVADAEFGVQALSYHIDTTAPDATKLVLTGAGMDLNLSTFAAKHGAIAEVDVSGTGANSIKLTLADLLQGTPNATLKITGDADDSVNLDAAAWTNTGNTVAQNGHTYAVYNDVSSHTAQLLIDQNLVNAGHVI